MRDINQPFLGAKKDRDRKSNEILTDTTVLSCSLPFLSHFPFHVWAHKYTQNTNTDANLIWKHYAETPKVIVLEGKWTTRKHQRIRMTWKYVK